MNPVQQEPIISDKIAEKAELLLELKKQLKDIEDESRKIKEKYQELQIEFLERMDISGIESIKISGHTFYKKVLTFPRIITNEFIGWAKQKFPYLVKETIHPQTLRGWYKEVSEAQPEVVDEIVEKNYIDVYEKIQVGIRKS